MFQYRYSDREEQDRRDLRDDLVGVEGDTDVDKQIVGDAVQIAVHGRRLHMHDERVTRGVLLNQCSSLGISHTDTVMRRVFSSPSASFTLGMLLQTSAGWSQRSHMNNIARCKLIQTHSSTDLQRTAEAVALSKHKQLFSKRHLRLRHKGVLIFPKCCTWIHRTQNKH